MEKTSFAFELNRIFVSNFKQIIAHLNRYMDEPANIMDNSLSSQPTCLAREETQPMVYTARTKGTCLKCRKSAVLEQTYMPLLYIPMLTSNTTIFFSYLNSTLYEEHLRHGFAWVELNSCKVWMETNNQISWPSTHRSQIIERITHRERLKHQTKSDQAKPF